MYDPSHLSDPIFLYTVRTLRYSGLHNYNFLSKVNGLILGIHVHFLFNPQGHHEVYYLVLEILSRSYAFIRQLDS